MKHLNIGITHGDFNSIGYEIILKALSDSRVYENNTIIIYGSAKALSFYRKSLDIQKFNYNTVQSAAEAHINSINLINCVDADIKIEPGTSTIEAGKAAFDALKRAVADLKNNAIDCLITAPINKKNINDAGFNFPGHTEYLAQEFNSPKHVMLLMNDFMKMGVVAGHVPLADVAQYITKERILEKLEVLNECMKRDFKIEKPRIAVFGLNPHAGDNGVIGTEEQNVIIPAIHQAREKGIMALGPYAADGFFGSHEYTHFDVILGMYHDQALAPFKATDFDSAVNYTAGLPIVRVSPGHGTAYNLANQNQASEASLRQAIYTACDICHAREEYDNLVKNQLK
ncbi:MAG: 4-hydroxythreonine-4-phosphate dehydrogenase PdxA [Bacteroidales bacterium]|jgi:4-hydroxythreonine-4-phosphate dehydrogenase|nr:4-hydroxythreonine-4-phosphate dehydrogenase PdxA [Bacteroidales bacterium]